MAITTAIPTYETDEKPNRTTQSHTEFRDAVDKRWAKEETIITAHNQSISEINNALLEMDAKHTDVMNQAVDGGYSQEYLNTNFKSKFTSSFTVTVGSGGDYATINEALEALTVNFPVYSTNRPRATVNMLTGFTMAEQVICDGIDLSWITITGADAETTIIRSALTTANGFNHYPAFSAENGGVLPVIDQLFNMDTSGTTANRHGVQLYKNARAVFNDGAGVKNAGGHGVYIEYSSLFDGYGTTFTGAGSCGLYVNRNSSANVEDSDFSGAASHGILADNTSITNAASTNVSNAAGKGIWSKRGSAINANNVNASGTTEYSLYAEGGTIYAAGANCTGSGGGSSNISVYSVWNATIGFSGGSVSSGRTIRAQYGGLITGNAVSGSDCVVYASYGGKINLVQGSVVGACYVTEGDSVINLTNSTYVTLNQTANTLTGEGIIYT